LLGADCDLLCGQIIRDISPLVLGRALKLCNFLDYQDSKVGVPPAVSLYIW